MHCKCHFIEPGSTWSHGYMHLITVWWFGDHSMPSRLFTFRTTNFDLWPQYRWRGRTLYNWVLCIILIYIQSWFQRCITLACDHCSTFFVCIRYIIACIFDLFFRNFEKKFFFSLSPEDFFCVFLQPFWTWWHYKTFCCSHFDVQA
jgi:hypothetical protein